MGPIYDGLLHFAMSPDDLIPALALALLAGLRGVSYGRRVLFVLPAAWLLGAVLGMMTPAATGTMVGTAIWFVMLGGLVAAGSSPTTSAAGCVGWCCQSASRAGRSRVSSSDSSRPADARYLTLQLAETYLTGTLFRQTLGRIEGLGWHRT
jgi:hypothetical protein